MPQISIIVEFETQGGREDEFIALMKDHARKTLAEERGCLRFEVVKVLDAKGAPAPNLILVTELYADQTALALHRDNPRMAGLRNAYAPMIATRRLTLGEVLADSRRDSGLMPDQLNASNDG
ncbi:MAG: putative quinol monooxygenase [Hyphomicrobiales bacterium]|nr:putative quinol monooxygenase [Hyphomicrobiales bacterium]